MFGNDQMEYQAQFLTLRLHKFPFSDNGCEMLPAAFVGLIIVVFTFCIQSENPQRIA